MCCLFGRDEGPVACAISSVGPISFGWGSTVLPSFDLESRPKTELWTLSGMHLGASGFPTKGWLGHGLCRLEAHDLSFWGHIADWPYRRLWTTTLLRIRRPLGMSALKTPNLGLERSFCYCVAGRRLTHTGITRRVAEAQTDRDDANEESATFEEEPSSQARPGQARPGQLGMLWYAMLYYAMLCDAML